MNLATERATVTAEPSVTVAEILGAVETAGYDARLITEHGEVPQRMRRRNRTPTPRRARWHASRRPAS